MAARRAWVYSSGTTPPEGARVAQIDGTERTGGRTAEIPQMYSCSAESDLIHIDGFGTHLSNDQVVDPSGSALCGDTRRFHSVPWPTRPKSTSLNRTHDFAALNLVFQPACGFASSKNETATPL